MRSTDLLQELIRFNTVNPPGNEGPALEHIMSFLDPAAVSFSACDLRAFSPNLQWTLVTDSQTSEAMEGQWRLRATEFLMRKAPGTNESCAVEVMVEIVPAVAPTTAA